MNTTANSRSVTDTTVPDVKNSRTESKFAHLIGEDADRCRPLRHFDRQHVFENVGRQHDVELLAGHIDDPAADHAQDKIEYDGDAHSDGERDQRRDRAIWHDAVVDVHDEKRARQRQHVHDQGGGRNVAVIRPETPDDGPEPVRARQVAGGDRPRIAADAGRTRKCIAKIFVGELGERT